jgi:hypothetical protein
VKQLIRLRLRLSAEKLTYLRIRHYFVENGIVRIRHDSFGYFHEFAQN